uniref:Junctional cadherin 5 associated n=1 Tax=Pseudonaja textilis TaxID=8673 RepID=A0A670YEH1_PSETE
MFSVDDLLISHGYKQTQNPTNSSEDPVDRDQHEDTGRQPGQAPRNGLPIHPGGHNSSMESREKKTFTKISSLVLPFICRLYDQSQLSRSSYPKKENDPVVWTRQGQDFIAHDYSDRVDCETRGKATASALFKGENQGQWEVEELDNMRSNKQEMMKPPGNHRRQSLKTETWKQPTTFGQHEPYIDNKESLHQYMYLERQNTVASHVKNKPQSFPGFISPENSNSAEIPALASSKQHKVKPELENLKYCEPATKYGRPLKPPSYEFHQQSRGIVETNPPHEEQERRKTKIDKPGQDSTLEPPEYNPPPSYKSPGQQSKNQHVPEGVSDDAECFVKEMQVLEQSICTGTESSVNQLQMEEKEQILCDSKMQVKSQERHQSSVQYIPFDDPRIRHFKVMHPADHQMEDQAEDANKSSIFCKNSMAQEFNNSHVHVPDSTNIAVKHSPVSDSSRWLVKSNADQDSCALFTQKGSYDTSNNMNTEFSKVKLYDQRPGATEVSSEILTKVKAFEPGTEIQGKNHLKKKTNETMFCLVFVPLQPEQHMPVSSSENKLCCNRHVKDQSFLSTSSSDSELQALAGNMLNKNVSEIEDLSSKQPPKPPKLEYSGSWPCSRYKDQQTQTNFREELPIQQPLHGSQLRKSNTLTNGHFLKYGSSTTESAPSSLPIGNCKGKPNSPPKKVQLKKPSNPECPRSVTNPKMGQNELRTTSTGPPGGKNEPSFAHKEERKSPCSVKEAFGQFLLKPVSRRPWDAISELESFNKEIQKQEERSEDAGETEQKHEREEKNMKKPVGKACRADDGSQEYGCGAQTEIKSVPSMFKKGTDKSKPESENVSNISDTRVASSDFRNVSSETREMDKSVGLKQKQENAKKIIKQAIGLHPVKSNVSNASDSENSSVPFKSINSREASVENQKDKDSDKLKKAAGRNIPDPETAPVAPLFFKRRNQGCSESKLRSVGLDVKEGISIPNSSTKNIPPNESLQARASRILGIEVAVESLTADNKNSESDNMAHSSELSNENISTEMKADVASSKGKPKSSWPKSTFIGEDVLGSVKEQCSGKGKLTREPSFWYHPDSSKCQEDRAYSLESAKLPLAERKSFPSSVEKKTRSTSKATLLGQGNVASAVSRAAMDRLARMKEVDSVSRMRRLSIKNAQFGEDRDEDNKQVRKPEGKGSDSAVGHTEISRKPSQGSCVSKRIISLNENEHLGNRNRKKYGRDLPSSGKIQVSPGFVW